jgi:hypothetical protein
MEHAAWVLLGIGIGGILNGILARIYYIRAAQQMEEETVLLRRLVNGLARGLHQSGVITAVFDKNGDLAVLTRPSQPGFSPAPPEQPTNGAAEGLPQGSAGAS